MKIVLIGYMGSGKTTIGKLLSKKLNINFIDLDAYIESKLNASVSDIFKERGELYFRKMEHTYVQELMEEKKSFILSTGGGTPCYADNLGLIQTHTKHDFYLKLTIPNLVKRLIIGKESRPLVQNIAETDLPEFIGKHLFERNNFYMQANTITVCDDKTPEEIVAEIMQQLK
ncbi:shikimate kinase [Cellulophaga sp. E16_2]|uniref:Shikimate kinase n=1 Tax=Cellulophaga algicola (strain DSM 14237 / IC166 / ACAM 630) TaxID=688270 RepID=E6X9Q3_CELAD|nr:MULTISPECIES: shikimate kinase [Cellulophaga]ADV49823.1 shikimate kinase [Cellulophaga algicola DSM 14237]MBO0592204.1 shikimate kinase [Cellulophaga sp. E16_2]